MRLALSVSVLAALAALAACSSTGEPASTNVTNQAAEPSEPSDPGAPAPADEDDGGETGGDAAAPPPKKNEPSKDAGTKDSGTTQTGPAAFTKAEVQALVNDRCAPCHIDFASGGMSLATDFTAATVGVASTEVPGMKRIAKGDHAASYLWHKVNGTHTTVGGSGARMPKNGTPLSATEIERLAKFIDAL